MSRARAAGRSREGWEGWDDYAPFYDWENARTMGRRDVAFWRRLARESGGPVLELGCGTGRIAVPVARSGVPVIGVDRSAAMLERARQRARRARVGRHLSFVRADIRALPFARPGRFTLVMAPYGILQSLLAPRDLAAVLAGAREVLKPGGALAIDLVAELTSWQEYRRERRLSGWRNGGRTHVTLIESVRQDRRRGLTHFDQEYIERRGGQRSIRRFDLTFRTLSMPQMIRRLSDAGFGAVQVFGDYRGGPWSPQSDVWLIVAARST
ncbi:MAG TPA: class I SAM-dependent methyltransferase [Vicinamibacterales bacterium]|nr:class I SAM-dependent methyltransferase [Vicinamibacterales bacterium]